MRAQRNHIRIAPHFFLDEFEDPTTGLVQLSPTLVHALTSLRTHLGCAVTVTSGYRSALHNADVGGVPTSAHLTGDAADITVPRARWRDACDHLGTDHRLIYFDEKDHIHIELPRRLRRP